MSDWFEDDSFWRELSPVIFSEEQWDAAATELDDLLALADYRGRTVLDLCCGPGRHALELSRRGFDVTAVDRTACLIDRGRNAARAEGLAIEWIVEDMRQHHRPGAYQLILNLFTSFGYFDDPNDDARVLSRAYANLASGGTLVIEMASKEWLAGGVHPTTSEILPDGSIIVRRHEIVEDFGRLDGEWILIRGDHAKRFKFSHRLYSGTELKALLRIAGFDPVRLYGDYDGLPFGLDARRLVALASKP